MGFVESSSIPTDVFLMAGHDYGKGINGTDKFLREIGGRRIIDRVLEACNTAKGVQRIFFVGPELFKQEIDTQKEKEYLFVRSKGSLWDNLQAASDVQDKIGRTRNTLIIYSDLPFLTSGAIDWIIKNGGENNLQVPVIAQDDMRRLEPNYVTYYWPMREFPFKWGDNLMVVDSGLFADNRLGNLMERHRGSGFESLDKIPVATYVNRMRLFYELGGVELATVMVLNFASKLVQMKFPGRVLFRWKKK